MRKDDFIRLINRYLSGEASLAERRMLEEYYTRLAAKESGLLQQEGYSQGQEGIFSQQEAVSSPQNEATSQREGISFSQKDKDIREIVLARILKQISSVPQDPAVETPVINMRGRRRLWAAAVIFLAVAGTAGYFSLHNQSRTTAVQTPTALPANDITPGGDRATLTLANGHQIILDTAKGGEITQQGKASVVKLADGELAYNRGNQESRQAPESGDAANNAETIAYNTLTTPRGGQYRITLSDGTKVWLNAASSLRYPTTFAGGQRVVEITGEVYFEVEKNAAMPFIVRANGAEVEVLGTAFNIMAYSDEDEMNTTLVQGAVRIRKGAASKILQPGQQLNLTSGGQMILADEVDIDESLAWKNRLFSFDDADISSVMRQIARWYDVDIKYDGNVTQHFNGNISRNVNVSKVFAMLELTGSVHFKIEGKQIVVTP